MNRDDSIMALRNLADLLDSNPKIPLPFELTQPLTFFIHDSITEAIAIRELMKNPVTKLDNSMSTHKVVITGAIAGREIKCYVHENVAVLGQLPVPYPRIDNRLGELTR